MINILVIVFVEGLKETFKHMVIVRKIRDFYLEILVVYIYIKYNC